MVAMENNFYALETMLAALARPRRRPLRARLGEALIALGEWLRRDHRLVAQPS